MLYLKAKFTDNAFLDITNTYEYEDTYHYQLNKESNGSYTVYKRFNATDPNAEGEFAYYLEELDPTTYKVVDDLTSSTSTAFTELGRGVNPDKGNSTIEEIFIVPGTYSKTDGNFAFYGNSIGLTNVRVGAPDYYFDGTSVSENPTITISQALILNATHSNNIGWLYGVTFHNIIFDGGLQISDANSAGSLTDGNTNIENNITFENCDFNVEVLDGSITYNPIKISGQLEGTNWIFNDCNFDLDYYSATSDSNGYAVYLLMVEKRLIIFALLHFQK